MFLIQYEEGKFINGESIQWLSISKDRVQFTVLGDTESAFEVTKDYKGSFLNNFEAINKNTDSVQKFYRDITRDI